MKGLLIIIGMWWFTEWAYASTVVLKADIKGDVANIAKIQSILPGVQKVINSEAFKKRVLAATYTSTKDSPAVIYEKIMKGNWNLVYEFKYKSNWRGKCPVLGWTYASVKTVWFNSCNFQSRDAKGVAGTVGHENMHKLGYDHKSAKDYQSVPYSIGNIVSELYGK